MSNSHSYEETLKAVHHAEDAVYRAQENSNMELRQQSYQQLLVAIDKVEKERLTQTGKKEQHRLHQAHEQLRHLMEAHQALED